MINVKKSILPDISMVGFGILSPLAVRSKKKSS